MTEFIELFAPGMRHAREQRDLDKVLIVEQKKGGAGPEPLDLESGAVNIVLRSQAPNPSKPETQPGD